MVEYPEAIGAFVAEMDFGTAPPVAAALHEAVVDAARSATCRPARPSGCRRRARPGAGTGTAGTVDPADVRPVADVVAALTLAIEHFRAPGTPVVLPTPAYMPFVSVPPGSAGR